MCYVGTLGNVAEVYYVCSRYSQSYSLFFSVDPRTSMSCKKQVVDAYTEGWESYLPCLRVEEKRDTEEIKVRFAQPGTIVVATLAATCKAILHHIALEAEQFQLATIHRKGFYAQPGFLLRASCTRGYRMSRCRAPYSRVRIKGLSNYG